MSDADTREPAVRAEASDVKRLESLWSGEFGDEYVERNRTAAEGRRTFWDELLRDIAPASVLEVGCNLGANLRWIGGVVPERAVFGVDINERALEELRRHLPRINALWGSARDLPFRDARFDLVFTMGVLIHQSPPVLPLVMSEIVRCARRYVLCGEYYAEQVTEVPYRGQRGALWKRDFGAYYQELFPDLILRKQGFLPRGEGSWDDVTYWLFEKAT